MLSRIIFVLSVLMIGVLPCWQSAYADKEHDQANKSTSESEKNKSESELSEEEIAKTAAQLYNEAHEFLKDERYPKAIEAYQNLQIRYPFSRFAIQAQLDLGFAYLKNGDQEAALATLDRFIKMQPSHPNIDYAYYLRGLVNFTGSAGLVQRFIPSDDSQRDVQSLTEAHDNFAELLEKYPNTKYRQDAEQRMIALRNTLAKHEIHIARYYVKRKAYVAAVRRALSIVENYPRSSSVPEALRILEKTYHKLNLNELADDIKRVYALNYPNGVPEDTVKTTFAEDVWNFLGLDED
ncbi:MAG TPA: outer membrane protein assembly factor BamD [Crenotrichaceae bacterium]|nr:outer membrane protein assembly factor BamD [Crenotrichaceae bacterium]